MYQIQIKKTFSASHAIYLPDGSLEPLHGHNWPVVVTVESKELDAIETVMDFHVLEGWINDLLATVHNRHLNEVAPFAGEDGKLAVNPTAERVAWWIGTQIASRLPDHVQLVRVSVGEADGCTAIYLP
ncbi:MAG TPA: 6-carboxytetrahydropterin synthase QueD [Phycisphaerales bacterium]|nr:6-carboxytetrahydropterin synthase QueD [Phycisphaerales bacterium]HCD33105.1 6-carboxytetrahydropterin synthase QueD [Phycisphaerales bacterium]|tara:strand:+ start:127 stop:510 length:384 start_codon:yes stop_codon:yes gene_type:complete